MIIPMIVISVSSFGSSLYQSGEERTGDCNVSSLGVSDDNATTDMESSYRPNLMAIAWGTPDKVDRETTINQYDDKIVKPEVAPSRPGYRFGGWKISGVKTCADFSVDILTCSSHENCVWKNSTCIPNPCVFCDVDENNKEICYYGAYNSDTGVCSEP